VGTRALPIGDAILPIVDAAVYARDMVNEHGTLEHALLPVIPGREAEFEAAFAEAKAIIAGMPGFVDLRLSRSIESPNEYLLLVHWDSIEAHEHGFRGSPEYERWRALLHHFYDPFPVVEHFAEVAHA
jgi:heme-degrading monooxygenase HmoA